MNNQNQILKWVYLALFVAFMFSSCWATVESLHLLLPTWPIFIFWIATIGVFILASLGAKMIVDSFNQRIYLEHRGRHLLGGIALLLAFWIVCSLPTNTHTFFYRSQIKDVLVQDITKTNKYLEDLLNKQRATERIQSEWNTYETEINGVLESMCQEIINPGRPGSGKRTAEYRMKLKSLLGLDNEITEIIPTSNSFRHLEDVCDRYRNLVKSILIQQKKVKCDDKIARLHEGADNDKFKYFQKELNVISAQLAQTDSPTEDLIRKASDKLVGAYALIAQYFANNSDYKYLSDTDRIRYESKVPEAKRILSVVDVWKDYFDGRWEGRGFSFWIIISALIDIAGFIFFALAFKKEEY